MKNSRQKRQKRRFSWSAFWQMMYLMVLPVMLMATFILFMGSQPRWKAEESARIQRIEATRTSGQNSTTQPAIQAAPADSTEEISGLAKELQLRKEEASKQIEIENGKQKLFVDESYGGKKSPSENEEGVAHLSVPSIGLERRIYRGIGASPAGRSGEGDFDRLYQATTWRYGQILGGDNYVVTSHIWSGSGFEDFSKEWFSPILASKNGGMTVEKSEMKLQIGDEIFVEEFETGSIFAFRITEIEFVEKGQDGAITDSARELLSSRIDKPRITLQGCLMNQPKLIFVVGELISVENSAGEFYRLP